MITTLNKKILPQTQLMKFFQWADSKAKSEQQESCRLPIVRLFYLTLALNRVIDRAMVALDRTIIANFYVRDRVVAQDISYLGNVVFDLQKAIDNAHDLALVFERDHTFVRTLGQDLDRTLALNLTRVLDRDRVRKHDGALMVNRNRDRAIDDAVNARDLVRNSDHACFHDLDPSCELDPAASLCEDLGLIELEECLTNLFVPKEADPPELWVEYSVRLQKIMQECRNIGWDWTFSWDEAKILVDYFVGTKLIYECLELACVSDREGVENRLLLPQ